MTTDRPTAHRVIHVFHYLAYPTNTILTSNFLTLCPNNHSNPIADMHAIHYY